MPQRARCDITINKPITDERREYLSAVYSGLRRYSGAFSIYQDKTTGECWASGCGIPTETAVEISRGIDDEEFGDWGDSIDDTSEEEFIEACGNMFGYEEILPDEFDDTAFTERT